MIESDNLLIRKNRYLLATRHLPPTLVRRIVPENTCPMRKLLLLLTLLLMLGGLGSFLHWAEQRPSAHYLSDLRSSVHGEPRPQGARGNVLLVRPQLFALDYQSPAHLRLKLVAALDRARNEGLLDEHTWVVFPEHIGTWLLARDEKAEFYRARNRQEVRDWLLLGNPLLAMRVLLTNLDADRLDETLLRMKAERMAEDYQTLFSGLARDYQVRVLAGSILLPGPYLRDGELHAGEGALRNISLSFAADGSLLGEPYSEDWPWQPQASGQALPHEVGELRLERSWEPGYPQSRVRLPDGSQTPALFLRGRLSWPIGGASRDIELVPHAAGQASDAPGTHLINIWIDPA